MPQMPSGRHVAIDVKPLNDLIDTWLEDASREQLARIHVVKDLFPYVRVLELVQRDDNSTREELAAPASIQRPDGFVSKDTGRRLSGWPEVFDD